MFFEWKLVGFVVDGVLVNCGDKDGVIGFMKSILFWVIYIWCVVYWLEFFFKDVFKGIVFDDIDEVFLCFYYFYENLLKKLR